MKGSAYTRVGLYAGQPIREFIWFMHTQGWKIRASNKIPFILSKALIFYVLQLFYNIKKNWRYGKPRPVADPIKLFYSFSNF